MTSPSPDQANPHWKRFCRTVAPLFECSPPHLGQLVNWTLLIAAVVLACWPIEVHEGVRQGPVSVFSWLPEYVLRSPISFWAVRGALLTGVILWAAQRFLPWSCWLTTIAFTAMWSLKVENVHNTAHIFNVANMLLVVQSLWITFHAAEIRAALKRGDYYASPLLPRWVVLLGVAYLGLFHTAAGLTKLWFVGPCWANGISLQLWTHLWGHSWAPSTWLILSSRSYTAALQAATLVIETAGVLAVYRPWRTWIGLGLLGFYAGVLLTFDYGFHFNALLTAFYLLPVEGWLIRHFPHGPFASGRD